MESNKPKLKIYHAEIKTPMSDPRIDNSALYKIPEDTQFLMLENFENEEFFDENDEEIELKDDNKGINYDFLKRLNNLEALYLRTGYEDIGLVSKINKKEVKLPKSLRFLFLAENDYIDNPNLNFDFLKDLPNLEIIYLYGYIYNHWEIFKNDTDYFKKNEKNKIKIKNSLLNPKKTQILEDKDFKNNVSLFTLFKEICKEVFKDYEILN